jgi:hypothetical protein
MALATYFSGLQVSGDGTNYSSVFANTADSNNLTLTSYTDTIVSTAANFMYVNSSAASTNLNTTLDGIATTLASVATAAALATEVAALEAADTTLQTNITAEATARGSAVTTLEGADTTLQTNIDAEATTRAAAVTAAQARLDAIESLLGVLQSTA